MQQLNTSKLTTTLALTVGAAALSVLGSSPAGATPVHSSPAKLSAPTADRAAHVDGKVVSTVALRIRSKATTNSTSLGSYAPGAIVHIKCKSNGQNVDGNPRWYKLSDRTGWLAARYVQNFATVPWC